MSIRRYNKGSQFAVPLVKFMHIEFCSKMIFLGGVFAGVENVLGFVIVSNYEINLKTEIL